MNELFINTDGGARGNPGHAGIGVVFYNPEGEDIYQYKEYIGEATNNQAEYKAVIKAFEILIKSNWFKENNGSAGAKIIVRIDSQLVVEQINGNFKAKNEGIVKLLHELNDLLDTVEIDIDFIHIPRTQNKLADKLVNNAIDAKLKN